MANPTGTIPMPKFSNPMKYRIESHFSPNVPAKMPASVVRSRTGRMYSVSSSDATERPRMKYAAVRNGRSIEKMHSSITSAPWSLPQMIDAGRSVVSMA